MKASLWEEKAHEMFLSQPELNLLRTSTLLSEYIRKHLDFINTPIQLHVSPSVDQMTCGWTDQEISVGRRLVQLNVARESYANFHIDSEAISPGSYTSGDGRLVISCIRWEEKSRFVVTSVDAILVLECLVGEQFSIEEKSRIRRNLQFLKPWTITRSNNESKRIFNSLMAMENPRPRNIEKDLKVFEWGELFVAVRKVLSKYSANPHTTKSSLDVDDCVKTVREGVDKGILGSNGGQSLRSEDPVSSATADYSNLIPSRKASFNSQQVPIPIPVNPFLDLPQHFNSGSLKFGTGPLRTQPCSQVERDPSVYLRQTMLDQARPIQPQTIQA